MPVINPVAPVFRLMSGTPADCDRRRSALAAFAAVAALITLSPLCVANAWADDGDNASLVLNRDSLGQTREQILEAHGIPVEAFAVEKSAAPDHSTAVREDTGRSASDREEQGNLEEAPAETVGEAQTARPPVNGTTCVDISVLAGNGLEESTRVCQAIFPD